MLRFLFFVLMLVSASSYANAQKTDIQPSQRFQEWDRNNDGQLAKEELPQALRRNFERVDANKDGFISPSEDRAFTSRNRRQPKFENVQVHEDIPYAADDNPRHQLDLILPKKRQSDESLPVIAFIHGGGWRKGNKTGGRQHVMPYVESGKFAGVSIAYRLSGEAQWPSQIHDCKAAIRWLRAHAAEYKLDADRIAVWGTSAGGHLVAMLGVSGDVEDLEGSIGPHTDQDSRVACVVDWFGPTALLRMNDFPGKLDHDAPDSPESLLIGGAIQEHPEETGAASPVSYVTNDDAPILIVHGDADPLVPFDQSERFAKLLQAAQVPMTIIKVAGAGHGGFRNPAIHECVREFLENRLLGASHEVKSETIPNRAP